MLNDNAKIAAIIVLYNPNEEVMGNLLSFKQAVDYVYLVDNSSTVNEKYMNGFEYIPLQKNVGFCTGLNIGCRKAIENGADILITLNQDTVCPLDSMKSLIKLVKENPDDVYGPNYKIIYRDSESKRIFSEDKAFEEKTISVPWIMTSGNIFTAEAFQKAGGYDDNLFVDLIDFDFCIKLKKMGYDIIRAGEIFVYQEPGNTKAVKFGPKTLHIPNLSPNRYYYIFRNEYYLRHKYGEEYKKYRVKLYKYIISIIGFEDNKKRKLRACYKGIKQGKLGSWKNIPYSE